MEIATSTPKDVISSVLHEQYEQYANQISVNNSEYMCDANTNIMGDRETGQKAKPIKSYAFRLNTCIDLKNGKN